MIILKPRDYYNEFDPYVAEWLRILIAMGHLPPGEVDERGIEDVTPPRAGMLKAYGNALNQAQAEEFIRAYMMSRRDRGLLA